MGYLLQLAQNLESTLKKADLKAKAQKVVSVSLASAINGLKKMEATINQKEEQC